MKQKANNKYPVLTKNIIQLKMGKNRTVLLEVPLPRRKIHNITQAEQKVADMAVKGYSNEKIAAERNVSPRTIEKQLRSIYQKMGVNSGTAMTAHLAGYGSREYPKNLERCFDKNRLLQTVIRHTKDRENSSIAAFCTYHRTLSFDLWHNLIEGFWSLVEHLDSGRAVYFLFVENHKEYAEEHRLSAREKQVAEYAAQGFLNKEIAWELGLSRN